MEENQIMKSSTEENLGIILKKIWNNKKYIIKVLIICFSFGIIIAYSTPKEYTTTVTLASEVTRSSMNSSFTALASMAGINLGGSNTRDALSPLVYPDVVSSTPFLLEIFDLKIQDNDGEINTSVCNYLSDYQKRPWWNYILSLPSQVISFSKSIFKSNAEEKVNDNTIRDSFRLTRKESSIIGALRSRIKVDVDTKTAVITIKVTMQDPLISATIADIVTKKLQEHLTRYRTSKARIDLDFAQKIFNENQNKYYEAQEKYAEYVDKNQNVMFRSVRTQEERLQNEMQLAYNVYNQSAQQLEVAKAKVQENIPIYAIIQSPSVPTSASKPSKMIIVFGFTFLGLFISTAWVLFLKKLYIEIFKK